MGKLEDDIKELLKNNGIKDEPNGEGDSGKEEGAESGSEDKSASSKVVADLADGLAKKIVEAFDKKNTLSDEDKKSAIHNTRSKIFTKWAGLKEVEYPSDLKSLTKDEKIVTFFKALVYSHSDPNSQQVLRALVEGTDSEGGYLVPEELRSEVFRILPDFSVMRRIARIIPMSTDTLKLNTLTARPVAYWTAEYESKSTSSAEFGQVTLSPNDLVCLLPVSEQLLADANINMVQFITELFAEATAIAEDKAFFTGSGTGQPKGIYTETLTAVAAGASLFDSLIDLMSSVPQRVRTSPGAAFVGNSYTIRQFHKVKDSDGAYIWRDGGASANSNGETVNLPDRIYGKPVYEQNDLPNGVLLFGDWRYYLIGDRQVMSVRTTTEGGEAWRRNAMEIKSVERVDGKAVLLSPFAKLTGI